MYFVLTYVLLVVGGDAPLFVGWYLSWFLSKLLAFVTTGLPLSPRAAPELQGKGSDGYKGGEGGTWRRIRKNRQGGTRGVVASYENVSSFTRCSRPAFLCAYG